MYKEVEKENPMQDKFTFQIIQEFKRAFPELVHDMINTEHGESETDSNPYHAEGSVWTHTMMVLNSLDFGILSSSSIGLGYGKEAEDDFKKCVKIAALCHDIGKCYTRGIKFKEGIDHPFITFYNHAYCSTQYTIEFLDHLKKVNLLESNVNNFDEMLELTLFLVSRHTDAYTWFNVDNYWNACNQNEEIIFGMYILLNADEHGQVRDPDYSNLGVKDSKLRQEALFHFIQKENVKTKVDFSGDVVYLFSGVPGSGKDWIAEKWGLEVYSTDNEIVDHFIDSFPGDYKNYELPKDCKQLYKDAWRYCQKTKFDALSAMFKHIQESKNQTYAISRTNLTIKGRKNLIHQLRKIHGKDVQIISVFVACTFEDSLVRDFHRYSKTVGTEIIRNFKNSIPLPSMMEGFTDCQVVWNGMEDLEITQLDEMPDETM